MTEGFGIELTGVISNPQSPQWEGKWRFDNKSAKLPFLYRLEKTADHKEEGKSVDGCGDKNKNRKKGSGSSSIEEQEKKIGEGTTPVVNSENDDRKIATLDPFILPGAWSGYFTVRSKEGEHHIEEKYELTVKGAEPPVVYIKAEGENMYGKFTQSGEFNQKTSVCALYRIYVAPPIDPCQLPEPIVSVPKQSDKKIQTSGSRQTNKTSSSTCDLSIAERKGKRRRSFSSYLVDPSYVSEDQYMLGCSLLDSSHHPSSDIHNVHGNHARGGRTASSGRSGSWGGVGVGEGRSPIYGTNGVEREWNGNQLTPVVEKLSTEELVQLLALDEGGPGQSEIRQALDEVVHPGESSVRLGPQHNKTSNLADGVEEAAGLGHHQQRKRRLTWRPPSVDEETGEVYEGEWQGTVRSGHGICAYAFGNLYEGGWKDGKENGTGVLMTGTRQVIYEGEWSDGRLCGRGTYHFKDGSTCSGDWRDNMRHGKGTYILSTGAKYEGEWRDNARCGRGKFSWPDGSSYDGDWLDDRMHGIVQFCAYFFLPLLSTRWLLMKYMISYSGSTFHGVNYPVIAVVSLIGRGKLCLPKGMTYDGYWYDCVITLTEWFVLLLSKIIIVILLSDNCCLDFTVNV